MSDVLHVTTLMMLDNFLKIKNADSTGYVTETTEDQTKSSKCWYVLVVSYLIYYAEINTNKLSS